MLARSRLGLVALVAWICVACGRTEPHIPQPRQIIVVSFDTLRADYVGPWRDAGRSVTPNLDAFADDAVVFTNALSTATQTTRAHKSLFYGLYAHTHRTALRRFPAAEHVKAPIEAIRQDGFTTTAFACLGGINERTGVLHGFEHVEMRKCRLRPAADLVELRKQAFAWLRDHAQDDFFLFLHTYATHLPYHPDAEALQRAGRRHGLARSWPPPEEVLRRTEKEWRRLDLASEDLQTLRILYEAQVETVDSWFGELVHLLEELDLYEGAAILVLSDHGEALGEGGHIGHSRMGDEQAFVPLIVKVPGATARRVPAPVSLVDVMPTLLDLLALDAPFRVEGVSLKPALAGTAAVPSDRLRIVEQGTEVALYQGPWRLIFDRRRAGSEQLTRWRAGASAEAPPELARDLVRRYAAVLREARPLAKKFVVDPTAPTEFSDDTVRELRALGYLD